MRRIQKYMALLLATVMLIGIVPITATAADNPNIELYFSPYYDYATGDYQHNNAGITDVANLDDVSVLAEAPLTYDWDKGALTLEKSKQNVYALATASTPIDADIVYGNGSIFAVTIAVENISRFYNLQACIKYEGGIVPVGVYSKTTGTGKSKKTTYYVETAENAAAEGYNTVYRAPTAPVNAYSSKALYGSNQSVEQEITSEVLSGDTQATNYMKANATGIGDNISTAITGYYEDAGVPSGLYTNPLTGESNYYFRNTAILATFTFKIVDASQPIRFDIAAKLDRMTGQAYSARYQAEIGGAITATYCDNSRHNYGTAACAMLFHGTNTQKKSSTSNLDFETEMVDIHVDTKTTTTTSDSNTAATTSTTSSSSSSGNSTSTKKKVKVSKAAISKLKAGKKQFKATWKKVKGVTGYQIQYSTSKKFTKKTTKTVTISKQKTTSKTVKKLKAKKKYYVRIRAYKKVGKTKYYSAWSKTKTVTTKK